MSNDIRTGVITANYNNGIYFKDCFKGLLEQSQRPNYICIIDDKSTDNSVDLIKETISKSARLLDQKENLSIYNTPNNIQILFHECKENRGPAAARNCGLEHIFNIVDIIFIADSDDIYYRDKIQKSVNIMKKYPHIGLVYSDYDTLDTRTGNTVREYKEIFSYNRLFEECIVSNNSAISANIIKAIGKYDENLYGPEDYDMWLRISDVSCLYHIPEALYLYRLTGNNITITTPKESFAQHVNIVKQKALMRRNSNAKQ